MSGRIVTFRQLRESGFSRRRIEAAVAAGALVRIARGTFATPDLPPDVRAAVAAGGSVGCVSALAQHGVWVVRPTGPHVRIDPGLRTSSIDAERIHRTSGTSTHGVDDVGTAVRDAIRCLPEEQAIAALDSALNQGLLRERELTATLGSGARARRIIAKADGRCESGLESLARVRLQALGIRVRCQVSIRGVGRVDLVVGESLVLELDGDEWHRDPAVRENDRRRDAELVKLGYVVLRAGYTRVMFDWPAFEAIVLDLVRSDRHRRRTVVHKHG